MLWLPVEERQPQHGRTGVEQEKEGRGHAVSTVREETLLPTEEE